MAGSSNLSNEQSILFADNMSFDGTNRDGQMTTNGQLWIGSTASNRPNNSGHVRLGSIVSPLGTINVGYSAPNITLDLVGGGTAFDQINVDATSGGGTDPVLPSGSGELILTGGQTTSSGVGANVIRSISTAVNSITMQIQQSGSAATQNTALNGVAHFDSDIFTVTNGFVSTTGGTLVQSITAGPGITITGTAAVPIINSVVYTDQAAPISVVKNSGSFATGTVTLTTPITAGLVDGDLLEFVATSANVLTIQLAATQVAHLGNVSTSVAGTIVSTAIGDSISMRYQVSTNDWWAISSVGNWNLT
jgi:hypothetical protein